MFDGWKCVWKKEKHVSSYQMVLSPIASNWKTNPNCKSWKRWTSYFDAIRRYEFGACVRMSLESYQDSFSHWDCFRRSLQVVNDFPKFPGLGKLINHILTTLITMPVTASKMFFSPFVKRGSRTCTNLCSPSLRNTGKRQYFSSLLIRLYLLHTSVGLA